LRRDAANNTPEACGPFLPFSLCTITAKMSSSWKSHPGASPRYEQWAFSPQPSPPEEEREARPACASQMRVRRRAWHRQRTGGGSVAVREQSEEARVTI